MAEVAPAGLIADSGGLAVMAFANRALACDAAADAIAAGLRQGLARRGWASLAASGDAPAGSVYRRLGDRLSDWSRVAVTLTDDVFAPPTHPASRAASLGRAFIGARTSAARFFPLWSAAPNAEIAAFGAADAIAPLRPFDSVLLLMDADGDVPALREPGPTARRGVAALPGGPTGARLSLELGACAGRVVLLAFGDQQREALERADRDRAPTTAALRRLGAQVLWAE